MESQPSLKTNRSIPAGIRARDVLLAPHVAGGLGLVLAAIVLGCAPLVDGTLSTAAAWGSCALAVLVVLRWLGPKLPLARNAFVVPNRVRDLAHGTALCVAAMGMIVFWPPLRGPEMEDWIHYGPPFAVGLGVLLLGIWLQRRIASSKMATHYLFRSPLAARALAVLLLPPLAAASSLASFAFVRPPPWPEMLAATRLLVALDRSGGGRAGSDVLLVEGRALGRDRGRRAVETALRLIPCQRPADAARLAALLLGRGESVLLDVPSPATLQGQARAVLQSAAGNGMAAGGSRLGALAPVDTGVAAERLDRIRRVATDPILRAWAAGTRACDDVLRVEGLVPRDQERAWLAHLVCSPDEPTAAKRHRAWILQWFPERAADSGDWAALPAGWHYRRLVNTRVVLRSVASFEASPYQAAVRDSDTVDEQLFSREPEASRRSCRYERSKVLHLWMPREENGAAWMGALARLERKLPRDRAKPRSGAVAAPPSPSEDLRLPIVQILQAQEGGRCRDGWSSSTSNETRDETAALVGSRAVLSCELPPSLGVVCGFPTVVLEIGGTPAASTVGLRP